MLGGSPSGDGESLSALLSQQEFRRSQATFGVELGASRQVFKEFKAADSTHIRFFGAEKKTQMRALGRLHEDLCSAIRQESNMEECDHLMVLRKKLDAVISLCKAVHRQTGFLQAYMEIEHFAKLEPCVPEMPIPPWMTADQLKLRAQMTDTAASFWPFLVRERLLTEVGPTQESLEDLQVGLLTDKLLELVRRDDGKTADKVYDYFHSEERWANAGFGECLTKELRSLSLLARGAHGEQVCPDRLEESVVALSSPASQVGIALLGYPPGRALVDRAKSQCGAMRLLLSRSNALQGCVRTLALAIPEGTDIDWKAFAVALRECDDKLVAEGLPAAAELAQMVSSTESGAMTPLGAPKLLAWEVVLEPQLHSEGDGEAGKVRIGQQGPGEWEQRA